MKRRTDAAQVLVSRLIKTFITTFLPLNCSSDTSPRSVPVNLKSGAVLPTARAAQGVGLVLFFLMMFVGGAGPPPEVLSDVLFNIGRIVPLKHVILVLQDPWLGIGWNVVASGVVAAFGVVAALLSFRFFRWE